MPAAVGTTTFGSYTLANPETEEWRQEWEPDESTKIMLDGSLQKRGTGFRRVFHYVARCSTADKNTAESAWRAYWATAGLFSPYGTSTEYSCVVRGRPSFRPLNAAATYWEVSMEIVEVTGYTA